MLKIPMPASDRLLDYVCVKTNGSKQTRKFHDDSEARVFARANVWVRTVYRTSPKAPGKLGAIIYRYTSQSLPRRRTR